MDLPLEIWEKIAEQLVLLVCCPLCTSEGHELASREPLKALVFVRMLSRVTYQLPLLLPVGILYNGRAYPCEHAKSLLSYHDAWLWATATSFIRFLLSRKPFSLTLMQVSLPNGFSVPTDTVSHIRNLKLDLCHIPDAAGESLVRAACASPALKAFCIERLRRGRLGPLTIGAFKHVTGGLEVLTLSNVGLRDEQLFTVLQGFLTRAAPPGGAAPRLKQLDVSYNDSIGTASNLPLAGFALRQGGCKLDIYGTTLALYLGNSCPLSAACSGAQEEVEVKVNAAGKLLTCRYGLDRALSLQRDAVQSWSLLCSRSALGPPPPPVNPDVEPLRINPSPPATALVDGAAPRAPKKARILPAHITAPPFTRREGQAPLRVPRKCPTCGHIWKSGAHPLKQVFQRIEMCEAGNRPCGA